MKRKHLILTVIFALSAMLVMPSCEVLLQGMNGRSEEHTSELQSR